MQVSRDLYELLSAKSADISIKIERYLKTHFKVKVEKGEYYTSIYIYNRCNYHISTLFSSFYGICSFNIYVGGDIKVEREVEKVNFWGKRKKYFESSIKTRGFKCFPFVNSIADFSKVDDDSASHATRVEFDKFSPFQMEMGYNSPLIRIDFEKFTDEIKKTPWACNFEIEILESINHFILEIISENQIILEDTKNKIANEIKQIDKNKDGKADILDSTILTDLIKKNQLKIIELDRNYLLKLIRISNYLKMHSQNIQIIFNTIVVSDSLLDKTENLGILRNHIHSYELLFFHSLNMINAIVNGNLIVFYEIHESFDKLNVFNSNWENEISNKLTTIGDKLDELMHAIYSMENNILSELSHLSYVTEASNNSITNMLNEIESSLNLNNLLTGIQTYQIYKIKNNTKTIKS